MKQKRLLFSLLLPLAALTQVAFADISLQDYQFNINGTQYCPGGFCGAGDITAVPGLNAAGFNATTGTGTLSYTTTSSGNFDLWIYDIVGTPDFNEYGAQSGSAQSNADGIQSWQIDVPDYNSDPNHTGTILANTGADSLDNTNHVPGTANNYFDSCSTGGNCNDITSMATGFDFSVASGYHEVITLNLSTTAPASGFYLETIHPTDPNNANATDLYFTASATQVPNTSTPEPGSWVLLGTIAIFVAGRLRRRIAA